MERTMFTGDQVLLKVEMLGKKPGAVGVVYEEYDIGAGPGVSVIFSNGEFSGFADWEQEEFLEKAGHDEVLACYSFQNVHLLQEHFRAGVFLNGFIL